MTAAQFAIHQQNNPSARLISGLPTGGATIPVYRTDVIQGLVGWHVVLQPHNLPAQGYPIGYSDNNVHYSNGPSTTGAGVPGSQSSDGRISGGSTGVPSY